MKDGGDRQNSGYYNGCALPNAGVWKMRSKKSGNKGLATSRIGDFIRSPEALFAQLNPLRGSDPERPRREPAG